jgi:hypothetical protein
MQPWIIEQIQAKFTWQITQDKAKMAELKRKFKSFQEAQDQDE